MCTFFFNKFSVLLSQQKGFLPLFPLFLLYLKCFQDFLSPSSPCIHNLHKDLQVEVCLFLTVLPSTPLPPLLLSSTSALFLLMNFVSHQTCHPTHTQCWDRCGLYSSNSAEHCTRRDEERRQSPCQPAVCGCIHRVHFSLRYCH